MRNRFIADQAENNFLFITRFYYGDSVLRTFSTRHVSESFFLLILQYSWQ